MLIAPYFGIFKISFGKIMPKAITTKKSAFMSFNFSINSREFFGCMTFNESFFAPSFTGEGVNVFFLPTGLSGRVITLKTSIPGSLKSASNDGTANCGVPRKTIFIFLFLLQFFR